MKIWNLFEFEILMRNDIWRNLELVEIIWKFEIWNEIWFIWFEFEFEMRNAVIWYWNLNLIEPKIWNLISFIYWKLFEILVWIWFDLFEFWNDEFEWWKFIWIRKLNLKIENLRLIYCGIYLKFWQLKVFEKSDENLNEIWKFDILNLKNWNTKV